jgi:dynein heavy chain
MEEWTLHQRNWIYLEPILNSSYAQKNLAKENKLFVAADQQWKKMMKIAKDVPHAKKWVDDFLPRNYYTLLKQNNLSFDQIRKSLEEMMEKKREVF